MTTIVPSQLVTAAQINQWAPPGAIVMYAGATAPSGWLLCDGTAVSRTTYAALFTAISTAYGNGDGSTTFNVPDMQGRFPVGLGTHADVAALGDSDGQATVGSRRPKHKHTVTPTPSSVTSVSHAASTIPNDGANPGAFAGTLSITVGPQTDVPVDDAPAYLVVNYMIRALDV